MTTAARPKADRRVGDQGQSVLEFLIMLPLMLGLVVLLLKVNTAIQMSIVNQQYSRAQALFLTASSPYYPRLGLRDQMVEAKFNQIVMGVSENAPPDGGATRFQAQASTQKITSRGGGSAAAGTDDVLERSEVRIRNTVTLCTQTNVVNAGGSTKPLLPLSAAGTATGTWFMGEEMAFDYCSSPLRYL